jgi:hypothetical protein
MASPPYTLSHFVWITTIIICNNNAEANTSISKIVGNKNAQLGEFITKLASFLNMDQIYICVKVTIRDDQLLNDNF